MLNYLSKSIIPIIFVIIIIYGMIKGRKVYEWFIEGAKEGLNVCVRIFPYLLAMIIAVQIFKDAHLLDLLNNFIAPVVNLIGLPKELIPLILIPSKAELYHLGLLPKFSMPVQHLQVLSS